MAESNVYVGVVSGVNDRSTYQKITSRDAYSAIVKFACFTKTPFMRVVGAEGFGVDSMKNATAFGAAKPTGRMIRRDSGTYAISGSIFAEEASTYHVGRLGNFTPEMVEGGDQWIYAWHRLAASEFIPDMDLQDNGKGPIKIRRQKMERIKSTYIRDFSYCVLGNSARPDSGTMGPAQLYADLPNLISVTQTTGTAVGGIDRAASATIAGSTVYWWRNAYTACTSVGGGGELDRPLVLRRKLLKQMNDVLTYAEGTGPQDYLLLTTQGFHQYYDRLQYADGVTTGKGSFGFTSKYDAAGVQTHAFNGAPMMWDPSVTVPTGATASTECCYGIHMPNFFLGLRGEESFRWLDWEKPRNHDAQRTETALMLTRYTPGVSARRPHWVVYNVPACPD